jgi:hypothetical protein
VSDHPGARANCWRARWTGCSPTQRYGETRALLVMYKGRIVAERYAPGYTRTPLIGWSMSKR